MRPMGLPDDAVEAMLVPAGRNGRRATRLTIRTILDHDPLWSGRLQRDVFRDQVLFDGKPVTNAMLTWACCMIEEAYRATPSREMLREVASCVAEDHPVHPVRSWLHALSWDGVERASGMLVDVLGVEDAPLHRAMGQSFLVGAVARAMVPGAKVDAMLVLVGAQGAGKSQFCAGLMPDRTWFGDTPFDLRSRDAYAAIQGKWLYEIAEMEALRGRSHARVKSFLSSSTDSYRAAYARSVADHPRQCVFIGTSNDAALFDDGTGSRRFWPVQIGGVNLEMLAQNRDQLWAEAVALFRRGVAWHLDPALDQEREALAGRYQASDARRDALAAWVSAAAKPFTTADALVGGLGLDRVDRALETRVGPLLQDLGCEKVRVRSGGERTWQWRPPGHAP
jgi:putative DNA primase/helicase